LDVINVGSNTVPELRILYKGQAMENMAMTQYAIWNSGRSNGFLLEEKDREGKLLGY
jgi:hypothetical protein